VSERLQLDTQDKRMRLDDEIEKRVGGVKKHTETQLSRKLLRGGVKKGTKWLFSTILDHMTSSWSTTKR